MNVYEFMQANPYLSFFLAVAALCTVGTAASGTTLVLCRLLRHCNIAARGWPPAHLDADGDAVGPGPAAGSCPGGEGRDDAREGVHPVRWNPYTKVVLDHRDGTVDRFATNCARAERGLPVPWKPEMAAVEVQEPPVS